MAASVRVLLPLALLLSSVGTGTSQIEQLTIALEVVRLVRAIGVEVAHVWKVLAEEGADFGAVIPDVGTSKEDRLLSHVEKLGREVDEASRRTESAVASVLAAQRYLPLLLRYEIKLDALADLANHVDTMYHTLSQYTTSAVKHRLEKHTLEDFAQSTVTHGHGSVRRLLDQLHTMLLGGPTARSNGLDRGVLSLMQLAIKVILNNIIAHFLLLCNTCNSLLQETIQQKKSCNYVSLKCERFSFF
jgi:hypothetical protein